MSEARQERLRELFWEACNLPREDQARFVERECADDLELGSELGALLEEDHAGHPELESPAAEHLRRSAPPHEWAGGYRILGQLGSGGMGVVYEAEQERPRRRVALKVMRPGLASPEHLRRFEHEAQVLGWLDHPGIAHVYEAGTADVGHGVQPFFVMERIEGVALTTHVESRGLDVRGRLELVVRIADAIDHAHKKGVVHRDLKPANVLVTREGQPKILDFGVALTSDADFAEATRLTGVGEILGTLPYMSPEQVQADPEFVDRRADVYALGVMTYEILTGRRPLEPGLRSLPEAGRMILEEEPPPLGRLDRRLRGDLETIVGKAMAKEREARYDSAEEFRADLLRYLARRPIAARPPSRTYQLRRFAGRNKTLVGGVVAVFAALSLGILVSTLLFLEKERQREAATRRAADVLSLSALQRLGDLEEEAERLWPPHPEHLQDYERWLARAARLHAGLAPDRDGRDAGHRARLASLRARALPWSDADREAARLAHPRFRELEPLAGRIAALRAAQDVRDGGAEVDEVELSEDGLPEDLESLLEMAKSLVAPERTDFGHEARGLALARLALERVDNDADFGLASEVLAWALFANGLDAEASTQMELAVSVAPDARRDDLERSRSRLDADIAAVRGTAGHAVLAELEKERRALEEELSSGREWRFEDADDRWWHDQLANLIAELEAFADPRTGVWKGTSSQFGWGIERRREFARKVEERSRSGPAAAASWKAAAERVRRNARYGGLTLAPQLGLVPLGPDPDSGLEEFGHPLTGSVPERDGSQRLVLDESMGLVFVLLPGGAFWMGAQSRDPRGRNHDPDADGDEGPVHRVMLTPFFLSKYEMTQGQWLRVAGHNPSRDRPETYEAYFNADRAPGNLLHPVEMVDWYDCLRVARRLGLTLPSEAQWEYAARGGTQSVWWTGDERESLLGAANLADRYAASNGGGHWVTFEDWMDDGNTTHARIGTYAPNGFGLHEVHGNVYEWCLDGHDVGGYSRSTGPDPVSYPVGSANRLARGGAFSDSAAYARSSNRSSNPPETVSDALGLRPVRAILP